MSFNVGDRVVCVSAAYQKAHLGKTYTVSVISGKYMSLTESDMYLCYETTDFIPESVYNSTLMKALRDD